MTTLTTRPNTKDGKNGKNAIKVLLPTLVRDIGLPTLAYYLLHWNGASDWTALLAGAVVSGLMLVFEAVKARKLEVFSGFMLCIFAAGLVATLISGDARMMIVKDSVVTAVVGLAFGLSALTRKPLIYFAARKGHPQPEAFVAMYDTTPALRRKLKVMSGIWGVGFLVEAAIRVVLAYQLPVSTMVWLSHVLMFGAIGLLVLITVKWTAKKGR